MLKTAVTAVDMDTLRPHTLMVCRISLSIRSRRTATTAESASGLGTITTAATADTTAVTAGITAVTAGITAAMVDITVITTAVTTVAMADIMVGTAGTTVAITGTTVAITGTTVAITGTKVDITDITESMEINGSCGLARLGRFNLPSLPGKL